MATKFSMTRDINGYNGFGLVFTDTAYSCTLTANMNTTLTVPNGDQLGGAGLSQSANAKLIAIFTFDPGSTVWVANNTAASAPAGATFAATVSEGNPVARTVTAGDVLNFLTTGTGVNVGVAFYWSF